MNDALVTLLVGMFTVPVLGILGAIGLARQEERMKRDQDREETAVVERRKRTRPLPSPEPTHSRQKLAQWESTNNTDNYHDDGNGCYMVLKTRNTQLVEDIFHITCLAQDRPKQKSRTVNNPFPCRWVVLCLQVEPMMRIKTFLMALGVTPNVLQNDTPLADGWQGNIDWEALQSQFGLDTTHLDHVFDNASRTAYTDSPEDNGIFAPVYIIQDENKNRISSNDSVYCVSIVGLDFMRQHDNGKYKFVTNSPNWVAKEDCRVPLLRIWNHVLSVFETLRVAMPVLTEFPNPYVVAKVHKEYAMALKHLLQQRDYGTAVIFICFEDPQAYVDYKTVFAHEKGKQNLTTTVVLLLNKSMLSVATALCGEGRVTGILNPSDKQSVHHGWVGHQWYRSPDESSVIPSICLTLFERTTLVLQHRNLNRSMWETEQYFAVSPMPL